MWPPLRGIGVQQIHVYTKQNMKHRVAISNSKQITTDKLSWQDKVITIQHLMIMKVMELIVIWKATSVLMKMS